MQTTSAAHMRQLVDSLVELEERLRQGGGPKKVEKQHRDGKLTARERIAQLLDLYARERSRLIAVAR